MKNNAAKIVSSALLGMDFKTVIVNGKAYTINPPTIHRIAGMGYWLADFAGDGTLDTILSAIKDIGNAARALSFLIKGDDSLYKELSKGTVEEVVGALKEGISLIDVENFTELSILARSVLRLTAKQK